MRTERGEVVERLECYLLEHQVGPGECLPSERELCQALNVSRTALRCAIRQLTDEGMLYSKASVGTFVAEPKIRRPLQTYIPFKRTVELAGHGFTSKVNSFEVVGAGKLIGANLHLLIGKPVYRLRRVRFIDGEPFMLDTSYLSEERFPGLMDHDFSRESLYTVLREQYGTAIRKGSESLRITYATEEEAQLLQTQPGAALFYIEGLALDGADEPTEYARVTVRPERVQFSSSMS